MTTTARIGTGLGGQGSLLQFFLIVDAVNVDLWFPEDEHPIIVHSTKQSTSDNVAKAGRDNA